MLIKSELFKPNLFSNYPESAPSYTPKPLTDEEREQLITINMAEAEDDKDCFTCDGPMEWYNNLIKETSNDLHRQSCNRWLLH